MALYTDPDTPEAGSFEILVAWTGSAYTIDGEVSDLEFDRISTLTWTGDFGGVFEGELSYDTQRVDGTYQNGADSGFFYAERLVEGDG